MLCKLGFHKWTYFGYEDTHRHCERCRKTQNWKDDYQNSGWEGSDFEPGHWEDDT